MTVSKALVRSIVVTAMTAALGAAAACSSPATVPNAVPPGPVAMRMSLTGTILDANGAPLAGVLTTASLVAVSVTPIRIATTDSSGRFSLGTIDLLSVNKVMFSATKPGYAAYAEMLSPSSSVQVDLRLTLTALISLPRAGDLSASLLPSDPPAYVGEPYESDYAWNARSFYFDAPSDSDLDVVLAWSRVGNAAIRMWAGDGDITSHAEGINQTIRLPRGTRGMLIVGQPYLAGRLTQPVPFTLTTTAVDRAP